MRQHVSAVGDEPRDGLRHGQRVVNKGDKLNTVERSGQRLRRLTCRGKKAENRLSSEFGRRFQIDVSLFLKIPEFPYNTVKDKAKDGRVLKTSSVRSAVSQNTNL